MSAGFSFAHLCIYQTEGPGTPTENEEGHLLMGMSLSPHPHPDLSVSACPSILLFLRSHQTIWRPPPQSKFWEAKPGFVLTKAPLSISSSPAWDETNGSPASSAHSSCFLRSSLAGCILRMRLRGAAIKAGTGRLLSSSMLASHLFGESSSSPSAEPVGLSYCRCRTLLGGVVELFWMWLNLVCFSSGLLRKQTPFQFI